jgi:predicted phosphodiesterase
MEKKIAILGDIHANIDALNAVLEDAAAENVTDILCVGDVVGYNAAPNECMEIIKKHASLTVCGNHDHYCGFNESLEDFHPVAANVIEWTRRELTSENIEWLKKLPYSVVNKNITLVHSTLDMPERWGYVFDSIEAESHLNYQNTQICFHGHTHVPAIFKKQGMMVERIPAQNIRIELGKKYFINTGSVGQPRDGNPLASYCIFCPESKEVLFKRVVYDIAAAQTKIRAAGLPERLAARIERGQ